MAFEVVGVGHAAVDHIGLVPRYPEIDTKVELEQFSIQGGGPVATALVVLASFGVDASFIGKVSDDDFGMFIRQGFREAGVDTSALVVERGCVSPLSFVAVDGKTGKRTIFYTRGSLSPLSKEDLPLDLIGSAKILHTDGLQMSAQIAAARHAREHDVEVVYDAGTWRDGSEELISLAHTVIASERFAADAGGGALAESLKFLSSKGPDTVVITMGEDGSVGMENNETYILPGLSISVVDTTGAGDVYHGAFIYAMLKGWNLRQRMHFANTAAALKCRSLGGRAGIPSLSEIDRAMLGEF